MKLLKSIGLAALLVLAGFGLSKLPDLVSAHGGDSNLVHGCIRAGSPNLPSAQGYEIRAVYANQACPAGFNAVDWLANGGPAGTIIVRDANGQVVGTYISDSEVARLADGKWFALHISGSSISNVGQLYFTDSTCSGTPYYTSSGTTVLPNFVVQANTAYYPTGPASMIASLSTRVINGGVPVCVPTSGSSIAHVTATLSLSTFVGPFSAKQ